MSEPTTAEICDCANTGSDAINTCHRVIRGRVEPPCDCDCHKPTQQQKCEDLARAMFPTAEIYTSEGSVCVLIAADRKPEDTWEEDDTVKLLHKGEKGFKK